MKEKKSKALGPLFDWEREFIDKWKKIEESIRYVHCYKNGHLLDRVGKGPEDVLSEIQVKAWKGYASYDSQKGAFTTWVHRIARNYIVDLSRKKALNISSLDEPLYEDSGKESVADRIPQNTLPHADVLDMRARKDYILHVIDHMKPKYATLLHARYFEELKYNEIAKKFNLPLGTVKVRLNRAREDFKKLFQEDQIQFFNSNTQQFNKQNKLTTMETKTAVINEADRAYKMLIDKVYRKVLEPLKLEGFTLNDGFKIANEDQLKAWCGYKQGQKVEVVFSGNFQFMTGAFKTCLQEIYRKQPQEPAPVFQGEKIILKFTIPSVKTKHNSPRFDFEENRDLLERVFLLEQGGETLSFVSIYRLDRDKEAYRLELFTRGLQIFMSLENAMTKYSIKFERIDMSEKYRIFYMDEEEIETLNAIMDEQLPRETKKSVSDEVAHDDVLERTSTASVLHDKNELGQDQDVSLYVKNFLKEIQEYDLESDGKKICARIVEMAKESGFDLTTTGPVPDNQEGVKVLYFSNNQQALAFYNAFKQYLQLDSPSDGRKTKKSVIIKSFVINKGIAEAIDIPATPDIAEAKPQDQAEERREDASVVVTDRYAKRFLDAVSSLDPDEDNRKISMQMKKFMRATGYGEIKQGANLTRRKGVKFFYLQTPEEAQAFYSAFKDYIDLEPPKEGNKSVLLISYRISNPEEEQELNQESKESLREQALPIIDSGQEKTSDTEDQKLPSPTEILDSSGTSGEESSEGLQNTEPVAKAEKQEAVVEVTKKDDSPHEYEHSLSEESHSGKESSSSEKDTEDWPLPSLPRPLLSTTRKIQASTQKEEGDKKRSLFSMLLRKVFSRPEEASTFSELEKMCQKHFRLYELFTIEALDFTSGRLLEDHKALQVIHPKTPKAWLGQNIMASLSLPLYPIQLFKKDFGALSVSPEVKDLPCLVAVFASGDEAWLEVYSMSDREIVSPLEHWAEIQDFEIDDLFQKRRPHKEIIEWLIQYEKYLTEYIKMPILDF